MHYGFPPHIWVQSRHRSWLPDSGTYPRYYVQTTCVILNIHLHAVWHVQLRAAEELAKMDKECTRRGQDQIASDCFLYDAELQEALLRMQLLHIIPQGLSLEEPLPLSTARVRALFDRAPYNGGQGQLMRVLGGSKYCANVMGQPLQKLCPVSSERTPVHDLPIEEYERYFINFHKVNSIATQTK